MMVKVFFNKTRMMPLSLSNHKLQSGLRKFVSWSSSTDGGPCRTDSGQEGPEFFIAEFKFLSAKVEIFKMILVV